MIPSSRSYSGLSALVFAAVAVAQACRVIIGFQVVIAGYTIPIAVSAILAAIALTLAIWGFNCWRSMRN